MLYVSNRCILDRDIKNRIRNNLGLYPNIDIKGLADIEFFGNVTLLTYQALAGRFNDLEWCNSFDIVVFDECHFFTSDATFNNKCGYILRKISRMFLNATRIYMSATIDIVLPYIVESECNSIAKLRWGKRFVSNSKYVKKLGLIYECNEVIKDLVWGGEKLCIRVSDSACV